MIIKNLLFRVALHLNAIFPFFYGILRFLKFNPIDAIYKYLKDLKNYSQYKNDIFPATFKDSYPHLYDRYENSGSFPRHYFYQDLWAAKKIYSFQVDNHFDIGSRVDGFIAHCLVFTKVTMLDIRPLVHNISNLAFQQANAMNMELIENNSIKSLSSLHAVEHFGLGRYGDPIDPEGYLKAINEMKRVLADNGNLIFAVPIGRQRLMFNAHRVFNPLYIKDLFTSGENALSLIDFSAIDDDNVFIKNAKMEDYVNSDYSCGLFHFQKI